MTRTWKKDIWFALLLTAVTQVIVVLTWQIDSGQTLYAPMYQVGVGFLAVSLFRLYRRQKGSDFSLRWFGFILGVSALMDVGLLWLVVQTESYIRG